MAKPKETIAERIDRFRGTMTIEELAEKAGVDEATVYRARSGMVVRLESLEKIGKAMGRTLDEVRGVE